MSRRNGEGSRGTRCDVVSLFSGAGGLDAGLEQAGWSTAAATDIDADAVRTLTATQTRGVEINGRGGRTYLEDTHILQADVRDITAADLRPQGEPASWRPTLLTGGPPCQPWSSAGHQRGLKDPRGQLFPEMLRLIDALRPRFVLFENVRGLLTALGPSGQSGEIVRSIQRDFEELGYASRISTLNAADFGAAQRRVRLILIATAEYELPDFPVPTHAKTPVPGLKPWVSLGEALAVQPPPDPRDIVRPTASRAKELEQLRPGTGIRTGGRVEANRPGGHWGYRQDCFVADPALPSRTIRAAATPDWIRGHDNQLRRLTWRECAILQGFPASWDFVGSRPSCFRQIGNAVQVDLARALGETLLAALQRGPASSPPVTPPWPSTLVRRTRYTAMEHRVNGKHRVRVHARSASPHEHELG